VKNGWLITKRSRLIAGASDLIAWIFGHPPHFDVGRGYPLVSVVEYISTFRFESYDVFVLLVLNVHRSWHWRFTWVFIDDVLYRG
jgi:hypothetical protein